ncbi:N-acetylmuramoyl-L-alanine amidase family protein [Kandleria vitulina]|uniref:N-acetylmuramoyl-L-alanine amidase family protein n=1 Tax=Kandleria vitulina TaxID=1630 RepID=UPI00068405AC|nr:N-acetylmuramoyl-L-alanine amidase [Kandleria vitulina]
MKKLFALCLVFSLLLIGCRRTNGTPVSFKKTTVKKAKKKATNKKKTTKKNTKKATVKKKTAKKKKNVIKKTNNANYYICIDAGHQAKGNNALEPVGPGSSTKKPKVSSGTSGVATKKSEAQLNLEVALKLQKELVKRGYKVLMIRTTQNVNISNAQRAIKANNAKVDATIRLHADGSTNRNMHGFSILQPGYNNRYMNKQIITKSRQLSACVNKAFASATNAKNNGLSTRNDMTGFNWSKVPVTLVEMGFMSNAKEDRLLSTQSYQNKMVQGIANGLDNYFKKV